MCGLEWWAAFHSEFFLFLGEGGERGEYESWSVIATKGPHPGCFHEVSTTKE